MTDMPDLETTAEERARWRGLDNTYVGTEGHRLLRDFDRLINHMPLLRAEMRERCATIADEKRDAGLNADLQNEPVLWWDGYEHGCGHVAAAIRALPLTEEKAP